jgi:hypothetical protein
MGTYRKEFNHCGLIQGNALSLVDEPLWQTEIFGERTVAVYAQNLNVDAAIGLSLTASYTCPARDVRHDINRIASCQVTSTWRLLNNSRQLVAHDPWILEVGLIASKNVQIGSADAYALHTQQYLIWATSWNVPVLGD